MTTLNASLVREDVRRLKAWVTSIGDLPILYVQKGHVRLKLVLDDDRDIDLLERRLKTLRERREDASVRRQSHDKDERRLEGSGDGNQGRTE